MTTPAESAILLVGLSGSGKTHFLVGLDVILDDQTDPNGLVHSEHAADRAYLQPLRTQWLQGIDLDHTSRQSTPTPHQLLVNHPASGRSATFHIPDLAGETFDAHFATRTFPHDFGVRVQEASGIILFLHCGHEGEHDLHEHQIFEDFPDSEAVNAARTKEWAIEESSKQVKLVDLLQFIAEIRDTPLKVAVVVSAWDLVENAPKALEDEMPKAPSRFVTKRWPLLAQFLQSNPEVFQFRTFGVSARGGGTDIQDIERLTSLAHPRERVIIIDGEHRSHDLSRPVSWLLGILDTLEPSYG